MCEIKLREKTDKRREAEDKHQGKEQSKGFSGGKKAEEHAYDKST